MATPLKWVLRGLVQEFRQIYIDADFERHRFPNTTQTYSISFESFDYKINFRGND